MYDFEAFGTEAEAIAFVKGMQTAIDMIDDGNDDHLFVGAPEQISATGEWRVGYCYSY